MSRIGPYYTLNELIGQKVEFADLFDELRRIPRDDFLRLAAGLLAIIDRNEAHDPSKQVELMRIFTPMELGLKIEEAIKKVEHPGAFFHRRQIWFALQIALFTCREDAKPLEQMELQKTFGYCCLLANDLLMEVELVRPHDPEEVKTLEYLVTALVSFHGSEFGHEMFTRAQLMWLEISKEEAIRDKALALGFDKTLDQAFADKYGIPLREFMFILTIVYFHFLAPTLKTPASAACYDPRVPFKNWFDDDHLTKTLALAGSTADKLALTLFGTTRQSWANDFTPLVKSPLIQRSDNKYVCPDINVFRTFYVQGIFELLMDAVGSNVFKQLFGDIFERYIEILIENFAPYSEKLANTFYRPICFVSDKAEAGDGLFVWQSVAVLLECKAGILTTRQRYAMVTEETTKAIEDQLAKFGPKSKDRKGIGQLAHNLQRIIAGDKIRKNQTEIDLSSIKIYPALVVYDEAFGNHAVRLHLQTKLNEWFQENNVDMSRIGTLLLFTIRDVEYFEQLTRRVEAEKLMKEYIDLVEKHPNHIHCVFHDFAIMKYPRTDDSIGFVLDTSKRVLKEVQDEGNRRKAKAGEK